jgi:hypothetical protein
MTFVVTDTVPPIAPADAGIVPVSLQEPVKILAEFFLNLRCQRNASEPKRCVVADYYPNSGSIQSIGKARLQEYNRAPIPSQLSRGSRWAFHAYCAVWATVAKRRQAVKPLVLWPAIFALRAGTQRDEREAYRSKSVSSARCSRFARPARLRHAQFRFVAYRVRRRRPEKHRSAANG